MGDVQPILWMQDKTTDIIEPNPTVCPALQDFNNQASNSAQYNTHFNNVTLPILQQLSDILQQNLTNVYSLGLSYYPYILHLTSLSLSYIHTHTHTHMRTKKKYYVFG